MNHRMLLAPALNKAQASIGGHFGAVSLVALTVGLTAVGFIAYYVVTGYRRRKAGQPVQAEAAKYSALGGLAALSVPALLAHHHHGPKFGKLAAGLGHAGSQMFAHDTPMESLATVGIIAVVVVGAFLALRSLVTRRGN